jgi:adenosylcobinamide-phosphate synthase
MTILMAFVIGFALDALIGDPVKWPHLVILMGKAVTAGEKVQRRIFPKTPAGEFTGGLILAMALPVLFCALIWALLYACALLHPAVSVAVESILIWQCLSMRSLYGAGTTVFTALEKGDLPGARQAIGQFVGRDTDRLDPGGVTGRPSSTVAENTQ